MKLQQLKQNLMSMQSALVAFSGGVDSTFLLKVARDVLGDRVLAVTATSPIYPAHEIEAAEAFAHKISVRHLLVPNNALANPEFTKNSPERCYCCKKALFSNLRQLAAEHHMAHVADGTNQDDTDDFRPGMRATRELDVRSPLREAGLSKEEIRSLSKDMGLLSWDKPSCACLASRIPYGVEITEGQLTRIDRAESLLRDLGFTQVRVRHYDTTAKIEVPEEDLSRLLQDGVRRQIAAAIKQLGYAYVTLDLQGYRSGSMNEVLKPEQMEE